MDKATWDKITSITTLVGVGKLASVFIILGAHLAGKIDFEAMVKLNIATQAALSGVGFIGAQDASALLSRFLNRAQRIESAETSGENTNVLNKPQG